MEEQEINQKRRTISLVTSTAIHIVLFAIMLTASAMPVKEKAKVLKVRLASMKKQEPSPTPAKIDQPKPKLEQPKPKLEQPKPKLEQPKPKQEQPKPKQEQPKPKLEQPKPKQEQPKPEVKPLPTPKPAAKKQPQPQSPPPKPEPRRTQSQSIADRLANAKQQQSVQQPRKSGKEIAARLQESLKLTEPNSPSLPPSSESAAVEVETRSYAEEVVRPYIQRNWLEPSKGELDVRNPASVEVSFTVYASGNVANARIVKKSNSRVLNRSVQEFLNSLTRLSPLSTIGSKSASLTIIVTMAIAN